MNIILDAMSGDKAPLEIIKGASMAVGHFDADITLVGNIPTIRNIAAEHGISLDGIRLEHAEGVITMEDDPTAVVRAKRDSSMSVGLRMLKDEGDAFVSAGNTGALHVGSSLIVRPIKGIHRAAIATLLPLAQPVLLLDSGANTNVTSDYLLQWAVMGTIYMKNIFDIDSPTVGLLNNGAESHKGTPIEQETYGRLLSSDEVNFVGNIEGNQIAFAPCHVLVTDGFTGNITLKTIEGMGKFFMRSLKDIFTKSAVTKMSFLALKQPLSAMKTRFSASAQGGAPLLGLKKPVIKAHGSSDATAIYNAIRQASAFVKTGVIDDISEYIARSAEIKAKEPAVSAEE